MSPEKPRPPAPLSPCAPPAPKRRSRRWLWVLVAAVAVAAGAAVGAVLHFKARFKISVADIRSPGVSSVRESFGKRSTSAVIDGLSRLSKTLHEGGDILVRLKVDNRTWFAVSVSSAEYEADLGGDFLGKGEWRAPGGVRQFPSGVPGEMEIPFNLAPDALVKLLGQLGEREVTVSVRGSVVISTVIGDVRVPFSGTRTRSF